MKLRIAKDFHLPVEAVTETFAILAKRGVGKTYTAKKLAEQMLKAAIAPVIVADPVGVWWGLRSSADGNSPGLPILVLGGDRGDAPLDAGSGEIVARMLVEERLSAVLDLSRFRKNEQTQFMTAFAERLYHDNREALHLMLDEADAFAPQKPYKGQERLLGAIEDLVRRGRARGIGVTLITQRAAVINKDVLTQAEVLVALRTIAPQDRAAIEAWIRVHGTEEQGDALMESLPSLPVGTAWFWSPGWLDVFQRVEVEPIETFDSSATPKAGKAAKKPKALAEVDIPAVREKLAASIERAKAEDPRVLRAEIARLQAELRKPAARPAMAATPAKVERVEVPAVKEAELKRLEAAVEKVTEGYGGVFAVFRELHSRLQALGNAPAPAPRAAHVAPERPRTPRLAPRAGGETDGAVSGGAAQRILDALAELEALRVPAPPRIQVAFMAGYTNLNSKGFVNAIGALRTAGLVDYPTAGSIALTAGGRARANPAGAPRSGDELRARLISMLGGASGRIVSELVKVYPDAIEREVLAERAGYGNVNSKGFVKAIGRLRSLGFIDYPQSGYVRAQDVLFLEGL